MSNSPDLVLHQKEIMEKRVNKYFTIKNGYLQPYLLTVTTLRKEDFYSPTDFAHQK